MDDDAVVGIAADAPWPRVTADTRTERDMPHGDLHLHEELAASAKETHGKQVGEPADTMDDDVSNGDPAAAPWMADGRAHTRGAVKDGDPHRDPVEELAEAYCEQGGDPEELMEAYWE